MLLGEIDNISVKTLGSQAYGSVQEIFGYEDNVAWRHIVYGVAKKIAALSG
jgi:hypothetical protein